MPRETFSSGSPFEAACGLSRAVKLGPHLAVSGTAPLGRDGRTVHAGDVYAQTRRCLEIALKVLESAGATLADVIRTRVLLVDITRWQDAARAHAEVFGAVRPASTFVQVSRFIDPEWLVELELDAFLTS